MPGRAPNPALQAEIILKIEPSIILWGLTSAAKRWYNPPYKLGGMRMGDSARLFANGLKRYAIIIAGFALFCTMLRQPYFGSVITRELANAHMVRIVLDGAILVLAVAAIALGRRPSTDKFMATLPILAGTLCASGAGLFAVVRLVGPDLAWLAVVGSILCASGFVALSIVWIRELRRISREELMPIALFAFTASLLLGCVDAIDGLVKDAINLVLPVLSAVCAVVSTRTFEDPPPQANEPGSLHIVQLAMVAITIEVVCCSLLRGTWNSGGIGYAGGITVSRMTTYIVSAAFGVVFTVIAIVAKQPEKGSAFISVLSLVCLILLIFGVAMIGREVIASFVTSLYSVLLVVLFAVLASASRSSFWSSFVSGGAFSAVVAGISLVAYTLIPSFSSYDPALSTDLVFPIALVAALVATVGICVLMLMRVRAQVKAVKEALGEVSNDKLWDEIAFRSGVIQAPAQKPEGDPFEASVAKAAELYRLTAREADIVKLFAQGRTIKRTAEELCLAPSTVQGYTKSIYAKLGVHGKDEIRDLLDTLA